MKICVSNIFRTSLRTCQSADWKRLACCWAVGVGGWGSLKKLYLVITWLLLADGTGQPTKEDKGRKGYKQGGGFKRTDGQQSGQLFHAISNTSSPTSCISNTRTFFVQALCNWQILVSYLMVSQQPYYGMVLITASCTTSRTSIHSSSGIMSIRSNPLNLFLTSTV